MNEDQAYAKWCRGRDHFEDDTPRWIKIDELGGHDAAMICRQAFAAGAAYATANMTKHRDGEQ